MPDTQIKRLRREFDKLQLKHGAKNLSSIYGAGKVRHPHVMLVFMNPTGRNVSTRKSWKGIRAPWLGTKSAWKFLKKLDLIPTAVFEEINTLRPEEWTPDFGNKVYGEVSKRKVFITNLAKCTQEDARSLRDYVFKDYLNLMKQEIEIVKPRKIVTFGNQVSSMLLDRTIRVSEYRGSKKEKLFVGRKTFAVYPTHYPVGQGMRNMPLAVKRVKAIL